LSNFRLASCLLLLSFALLGAGCAPAPPKATAEKPAAKAASAKSGHGDMAAWRLEELSSESAPALVFAGRAGTQIKIETPRLRMIHATAQRVLAAAGPGEAPEWLLIGTPAIIAFATYQGKQPLIGITLGMVDLLKDDEGAWGALFGHELAHFRLGHHAGQRARKESLEVGTSIAGLLLSVAGLGFGSAIADATGTLVERSFSRDDESNADFAGLNYARAAGLDPYGALRLQERLLASRSTTPLSFLSTHPSGQDRIDRLRTLLEEHNPTAKPAH
jgi:predicted Zn-dependent protease